MEDDEKKSESLLVRVEPDIKAWYATRAKRRRVKLAQVLREALYGHKEAEEKKEREQSNGELRELQAEGAGGADDGRKGG